MSEVNAQCLLLSALKSLTQVVQTLLFLVTGGRGPTPVCPSFALASGDGGCFSSPLTARRSDNLPGLDRASNRKRVKVFICNFSFLSLIAEQYPHKSTMDGIQLRQCLQIRVKRYSLFFRSSYRCLIPLLEQAPIKLVFLLLIRPLQPLLLVANAQAL